MPPSESEITAEATRICQQRCACYADYCAACLYLAMYDDILRAEATRSLTASLPTGRAYPCQVCGELLNARGVCESCGK
jgi:hypothetical protein